MRRTHNVKSKPANIARQNAKATPRDSGAQSPNAGDLTNRALVLHNRAARMIKIRPDEIVMVVEDREPGQPLRDNGGSGYFLR